VSFITEIPGVGPATLCEVASVASHRPTPLRFVWHHCQPETAGGATDNTNLIQVCDSCHYSIHRILYALAQQYLGKPITTVQQGYITNPPRKTELAFAQRGLQACIAAGTVDKIPNEG
jgi:hypothetical protein